MQQTFNCTYSPHHPYRYALDQYLLLVFFTIATLFNFIVRAVRVINAFCKFLKIRCLVIPKAQQPVLPVTHDEAESLLISQNNNSTYNSI